jgi:hypothetical protein
VRTFDPVRKDLLERLERKPKLKKLLQVSTRDSPMHTASGVKHLLVLNLRRTAQGLSDSYAEDEEDGFQGGHTQEKLSFSWMARCLVRFENDPFVLAPSDRDMHQACVEELRAVFRESIEHALPGPWWTSPTEAESGGSDMPPTGREANWLFRHSDEERDLSQVGPVTGASLDLSEKERD